MAGGPLNEDSEGFASLAKKRHLPTPKKSQTDKTFGNQYNFLDGRVCGGVSDWSFQPGNARNLGRRRMKQFFERVLKVYSHEFGRFIWLSALFLAIFFVTAIFRNYVDTAFLKRFGPAYIPWMLVISAVLTMVVLSFADRIARKSSDSQLMSRLLFFYAAGAVLCFFLVKAKFTLVYPILYQGLQLLDSILLVYLWNIAGDLFDARARESVSSLSLPRHRSLAPRWAASPRAPSRISSAKTLPW